MKHLYVIGFKGTGISTSRPYQDEHPMIRAGHVGFFFEGEKDAIYGFQPTEEGIRERSLNSAEQIFKYLMEFGNTLPGKLHLDRDIFVRAAQLAKEDPRAKTTVLQISHRVNNARFDSIKKTVQDLYFSGKEFLYAFPLFAEGVNNCATFPHNVLGFPFVEQTGRIKLFLEAMRKSRTLKEWQP